MFIHAHPRVGVRGLEHYMFGTPFTTRVLRFFKEKSGRAEVAQGLQVLAPVFLNKKQLRTRARNSHSVRLYETIQNFSSKICCM